MTSRIDASDTARMVASGIAQVEQEQRRVGDVPDNLEVDVDDVFVRRQHQAVRRRAGPVGADRDRVFPRHRKHFGRDQRPGREVQTRVADGRELTQEQLDRLLFRPDRVEGVERPEANDQKRGDAEGATGELEPVAATATTAGPAATAAHQDLELFLPFADNLVDLRDLLIATGPPGSTGSAARAIVAPVAAA
jgi:hypothetical protein